MLTFPPGAAAFAIAGIIAAAGPVIIHLLNRRRHRVVHWAAMDLLREALSHSRRAVHLRDLLLLLLRTAAVVLFGLALARPYFSQSAVSAVSGGPVHAVLLIDNSLSMGYQRLSGTLLDEAKSRAVEFTRSLPQRSRVTVLPLCADEGDFSLDAYRTVDDAVAAIERVEVVDRSGSVAQGAELAAASFAQAADVPESARRVVLFSDHQAVTWRGAVDAVGSLPELQLVDVSAAGGENTWVSDLTLQDGIASAATDARFVAKIQHAGAARSNVPVSLSVGGVDVQTRIVDLQPGQTREVLFDAYAFEAPSAAGQAHFVAASVSIPPDHLELDNGRYLSVPVVGSLPVVFVDSLGSDEEPASLQYGETRQLRGLLAPNAGRGSRNDQLVEVRQAKIGEVDRTLLEDARMVVIAGVTSPGDAVADLRDYVSQGGQLVIIADESFDAAEWNGVAWQDGAGILPAPLLTEAVGRTPNEVENDLSFFRLDFESMSHEWFRPAEVAEDDLRAHYAAPVFFKAIDFDLADETISGLVASEAARLTQQRDSEQTDENQQQAQQPARWVSWGTESRERATDKSPQERAELSRPHVLARFDNGRPFIVERRIGQGNVLFVTSSLFVGPNRPMWNTLPRMKAMFMFDRILRSMIERTLPKRTLDSLTQISLPIRDNERLSRFVLSRPDGGEETLPLDALASQDYAVTIRGATQRGIYTVTAYEQESGDQLQGAKLWSVPLALNGPVEESDLAPITQEALGELLSETQYRWIAPGETISVEGAQVWGQNLWWWFALAVLGCLLLEMAVLARPAHRPEAA